MSEITKVPVHLMRSLDEDNLSSNSDQAVPTQQSVKAFVDSLSGEVVTRIGDTESIIETQHVTSGELMGEQVYDIINSSVPGAGTVTINAVNHGVTSITLSGDLTVSLDFGSPPSGVMQSHSLLFIQDVTGDHNVTLSGVVGSWGNTTDIGTEAGKLSFVQVITPDGGTNQFSMPVLTNCTVS